MPTKRCPVCERFFDGGETYCPHDASTLEAWQSEDPAVGRLLDGRYRILRRLGAGGMGVVYLAEQMALDRHVAIKLLRPERLGDADAAARFAREAKAVSGLRSPHLARLHDFGQTEEGERFLVMELLVGKTLRELLSQRGRLDVQETASLLDQAARALGEAHQRGIVHRDLKPENIFVEETADYPQFVRVLDFGIAWLEDTEGGQALTSTSQIPGTPAYLPPERIAGEKVDARADVYALGVLAYEMLTGHKPFDSANSWDTLVAHLHQDPIPLTEACPEAEIPDAIHALVLRCLAKSPQLRPADARAFRLALTAARGEQSPLAATGDVSLPDLSETLDALRLPPRTDLAARPPNKWRSAAVAAIALAGGVGLGFALQPGAPTPEPARAVEVATERPAADTAPTPVPERDKASEAKVAAAPGPTPKPSVPTPTPEPAAAPPEAQPETPPEATAKVDSKPRPKPKPKPRPKAQPRAESPDEPGVSPEEAERIRRLLGGK